MWNVFFITRTLKEHSTSAYDTHTQRCTLNLMSEWAPSFPNSPVNYVVNLVEVGPICLFYQNNFFLCKIVWWFQKNWSTRLYFCWFSTFYRSSILYISKFSSKHNTPYHFLGHFVEFFLVVAFNFAFDQL